MYTHTYIHIYIYIYYKHVYVYIYICINIAEGLREASERSIRRLLVVATPNIRCFIVIGIIAVTTVSD